MTPCISQATTLTGSFADDVENYHAAGWRAVEVWLTTGPNETSDRVDLGDLKGNVGDQQYEVPADADLERYSTVVLYCTPFTVRIAVADLKAEV